MYIYGGMLGDKMGKKIYKIFTYCQILSGGIFEFVLYALYGIDNFILKKKNSRGILKAS